jgi:hypothetical protein
MSSVPTGPPTWLRIEACQGAWVESSTSRYFTGTAGRLLSADVHTCVDMGAEVRTVGAGLRVSHDRWSQARVVRGRP